MKLTVSVTDGHDGVWTAWVRVTGDPWDDVDEVFRAMDGTSYRTSNSVGRHALLGIIEELEDRVAIRAGQQLLF